MKKNDPVEVEGVAEQTSSMLEQEDYNSSDYYKNSFLKKRINLIITLSWKIKT